MPAERRRRRRRRRDPRAAGDMIGRYRAGGAPPSAGGVAALAPAWGRVVGDVAARHSEPLRLSRAGMLTVACSDGAWAQELTFRREELLERLRAEQPGCAVSGLRFAVADHVISRAAPPAPARRPPPAPGPAERAAGEAAAEGIADERIRALVARLAAGAAARGPKR